MNGLDPADDSFLLRMVWSPRCFEEGRPTVACFDSSDLLPKPDKSGKDRFVSADCEAEIVKLAVDARIAHQTRGDLRERERREDARFLRLSAAALRSIPDNDVIGENPIIVERDRVPENAETGTPANPAHCAIRNRSTKSRSGDGSKNRAYVDYLRKELMKRIISDLSYGEVFP